MATVDDATAQHTHPGPLRHNRDFWLLWGGQAISQLGSQVSNLALPLLILALTNSPAQAGLIAALQRLPYLVLGLPAGALVDRWDRKAVMIACDALRCVVYGSIPLAAGVGQLHPAQFYFVALLGGGALAFFDAADNASFPRVVPPAHLPRATAVMESTNAFMDLLGPGLGGVLVSLGRTIVAGAAFAYAADSLSYLASAISLVAIRIPFQAERAGGTARSSLRADITAGIDFLWRHRRLRTLAAFNTGVLLLIGPASLAVIVLAHGALRADARTIGLIFALGGAGGLVGALAMPIVQARLRVGQTLIGAVLVWLLSMVLLAVAPSPAFLVVGWALVTVVNPIYFTTLYAYRVTLIPDELQGRVNSVFRLLAFAGSAVGPAIGGILLGPLGPRLELGLSGLGLGLCIVAVVRTDVRKV